MKNSTMTTMIVLMLSIVLAIGTALLVLKKLSNASKKESNKPDDPAASQDLAVHGDVKEFTTRTGKVFSLKEGYPIGEGGLTTIIITPEGLQDNAPVIFKDVAPMTDAVLADLDHDGFDELYIITESFKPGSYKSIIGVASQGDKFLQRFSLPKITEKDMAEGGSFHGYMGNDYIEIKGENIIRTFPVYIESTYNVRTTGWKRSIYYHLRAGDQLEIAKVENKKGA